MLFMNFLRPDLLIWLSAAVIPLLIYLFFRKKLKRIEFSSLYLLRELAVTHNRRIRLENLLLLLIRTALIITLVLFFAGLYFGQKIIHSADLPSRILIYLDSSPSMQSTADGFTLQQKAAAAARKLSSLFPQGEVKVITSQPGEEYFISNQNDYQALDKIREAPADRQLADILSQADKFFRPAQNDSADYNNHFFILSDAQLPSDSAISAVSGRSQNINRFLFRLPVEKETDYSLDSIKINSNSEEQQISCYISAETESDEPPLLELFGDNSKLAEQRVNLQDNKAVVNFLVSPVETARSAYLKLPSDRNNSNNTVYFKLPGLSRHRILLAGDSTGYSCSLLKKMFNLAEFRNSYRVEILPINRLAQVELSGFAGIITASLPDLNSYTVSQMADYLQNGGGLFIFAGNFDPASYNNLTAPKLGLPQISGLNTLPSGYFPLTNVNSRHPVLSKVFQSGFKLNSVEIYRFYDCKAAETIISAGSSALISAGTKGQGRTLFSATSLDKSWSNLAENGLLVPLIFNGLQFLTASRGSIKSFYMPGEEISTVLPSLAVTVPDDSEILTDAAGNLPTLQQHGFYNFRHPNGTVDFFAFNSRRETSPSSGNELKEVINLTKISSSQLDSPDQILGMDSSWSRQLLVILFLLLTAEMILTRRKGI